MLSSTFCCAQTSSQRINAHKQWIAANTPKPEELDDEQLIIKVSFILSGISNESAEQQLILACSKWDENFNVYVKHRQEGIVDLGYKESISLLKILENISINNFGKSSLATACCRYALACVIDDNNGFLPLNIITQCISDFGVQDNDNCELQSYAFMFQATKLLLTLNVDYSNPKIWNDIFLLEKNVAELYKKWNVHTLVRANTYQLLGDIKGQKDDFIPDLIDAGCKIIGSLEEEIPQHVTYSDDQPTNSEGYYRMAFETSKNALGEYHVENFFFLHDYAQFLLNKGVPTDSIYSEVQIMFDVLNDYLPKGSKDIANANLLKCQYHIWYNQHLEELSDYETYKNDIKKFYGNKSDKYINFLYSIISQQFDIGSKSVGDLFEEYKSLINEANDDNYDLHGLSLLSEYNISLALGLSDATLTDLREKIAELYQNFHRPLWRYVFWGNQIVWLLNNTYHIDEAIEISRLRLEDIAQLVGKEDITYAYALINHAELYPSSKYKDRLEIYKEALSIFEKNKKESFSIEYYIANTYYGIGDYSAGYNMMKSAIEKAKKCGDVIETAKMQIMMASYYLYVETEETFDYKSLFEEAIPVFLAGEDSLSMHNIDIYQIISDYYIYLGKYEDAINILQKADDIYIAHGGRDENLIMLFRKSIADIYSNKLNMYDKAAQIYDSEIERLKDNNLYDNSQFILSYLFCKWNVIYTGRNFYKMTDCMADIQKYFNIILSKYNKADFNLWKDYVLPNIDVSTDLIVYSKYELKKTEINDFFENAKTENLEFYKQMIAKYENTMNQLNIYSQNLRDMLQLMTEELPNNIENYQTSVLYRDLLYKWEQYYRHIEENQEMCKKYLEETLLITKNLYPTSLSSVLLEGLSFYSEIGDEQKISEMFHLLKTEQDKLRMSDIDACYLLSQVMYLLSDRQKYEQMIPLARNYNEKVKSVIIRNFDLMSQSEREDFLSRFGTGGSWLESLLHIYPDELSDEVYNEQIFQKGLLLRSSERIRRHVINSGDEDLITSMTSVEKLRSSLNQNISTSNITDTQEQWNKKRDIILKIEKLEHEITRKAAEFLPEYKTVLWTDVQNKLQKNDVAIEFVFSDSIIAALVIKRGVQQPLYVELQNSEFLYNSLNGLASQTAKGLSEILYNDDLLNLYDRLWKPLEQSLNDCKRVFISPSGFLSNIAFNAIKTPDGKALIDRFDIYQLSSTAELTSDYKFAKDDDSAIIFGGIYYDKKQETSIENMNKAPDNKEQNSDLARNENRGTKGEAFRYLPGSLKELSVLSALLNKSNTQSYKGLSASESLFNKFNGDSPRIIHLATHGFFIKDVQNNSFVKRFNDAKYDGMLRAGLALSNANETWKKKITDDESNDGILTAKDLSLLDLSNTELMVVSACESALGIYTKEGIYGIQRGIKQAGVKSMIVSLWSVSDSSTTYFMEEFYSKWKNGMSKHNAMKHAIIQTREKYPSPYNWAPFIMLDAINN